MWSVESIFATFITAYAGTILFFDKDGFSMGSVAFVLVILLARSLGAGPLVLQVMAWHYTLLSPSLIN